MSKYAFSAVGKVYEVTDGGRVLVDMGQHLAKLDLYDPEFIKTLNIGDKVAIAVMKVVKP